MCSEAFGRLSQLENNWKHSSHFASDVLENGLKTFEVAIHLFMQIILGVEGTGEEYKLIKPLLDMQFNCTAERTFHRPGLHRPS